MGDHRELTPLEFRQRLKELLLAPVLGHGWDDKLRAARGYLGELEGRAQPIDISTVSYPDIAVVPFAAGKRPLDEALVPGSGASEHVGMLDTRAGGEGDQLLLLYRLTSLDVPFAVAKLAGGEPALDVVMSAWFVPDAGEPVPVPGLQRREVPLQRVALSYPAVELEAASLREFPSARYVAALSPGDAARGPGGADMFSFEHAFGQRVRVELALRDQGEAIASAATEVEIFDVGRFGSLYERLLDRLVTADTAQQAARLGIPELHHEFHPWFPVLAIGMDKANLYLWAIRQDLEQNRKHLPDPAWLLRVGLYLELLTCIGIFEAVREEYPELLSASERRAFEHDARFAEVRRRIDVAAWRRVWALREIAPRGTFLSAGPVSLTNMLRKEKATLAFLHAHHEDLKHAIELAGPNLHNAQETWHRVFRDAERAVLGKNAVAFPELRYLDPPLPQFVLWHQAGDLPLFGRLGLPTGVTSLFGDQDAILPSACRQYRQSMNEVAAWARARGLMDFTGDECVPASASLLEAYMGGAHDRLAALQRRDGYAPTLELSERLPDSAVASVEEIAALLGKAQVLRPLMDRELARLARAAQRATFGPHDRIVVEGQPGSSLFVVASGTAEVLVRRDGRDVPVGTLESGAVFGEAALLTGVPRTATVRSVDDVVLYEIDKGALEPILAQRPQLIVDLSLLMASRQAAGKPAPDAAPSLAARIKSFFGA
jgi:hypothetical protein